ncbi:type II toxin-antitoxin system PemK/MazF family toxin [Paenibacillus sp. MZ04-78.2]|uniref:type II toxin-antitoxin system PemK/MazF family toxin n=1 Tax=Paenibacillus sp. MZ04-78.2 TaxID=2962034 RepID=UPI0020B71D4C|nr:type II toxin-antitoxin system PemK/MazF family toxin [Paenibacillus sp. MZ04-78.2]MCP3776329.1 type II toxin-antitoxin system PemK/MazF family toxin [Paenibacillus sp. MZ04-78.2]
MNYQELLDTILALDTADIEAMAKLQVSLQALSDPDAADLSRKLKEFENIVTRINLLSVTPPSLGNLSPRQRFLERVERLSDCENRSIPAKGTTAPGTPEPYFQKLDVIYCDFGGVGKELDAPHFAIVWEDTHDNEEITVIPTTSQFAKESETLFSLGWIRGLPATDTIALVHKIGRISRKRAMLRNGRYLQGTLMPARAIRIDWGIASFLGREKTLHYHIRENCGDALPERLGSYSDSRFAPVRDFSYDGTTVTAHYRLWNETTMKTLQLKRPQNRPDRDMKGYKKLLLDRYYSGNEVSKRLAESDFVANY